MEHHVGIDVSLQLSSLCVLDATGKVLREVKVASEPEALVASLRKLGLPIARVGLEAGPLSQWLFDGLREAGFDAVLLETRHEGGQQVDGVVPPYNRGGTASWSGAIWAIRISLLLMLIGRSPRHGTTYDSGMPARGGAARARRICRMRTVAAAMGKQRCSHACRNRRSSARARSYARWDGVSHFPGRTFCWVSLM